MTKSNPAKRLYEILKKASSHNKTLATQDVWKQVLNIHSDVEFLAAFSDLVLLVEKVRSLFDKLPNDKMKQDYAKNFHIIERVVSINHLHGNWANNQSLLKEEHLQPIQFFAHQLESLDIECEDEIPKIQLDEWKETLEKLLDQILNSDLELKVKLLFEKQIMEMIHSINMYKINGSEGLKENLRASLGNLISLKSLVPNSKFFRVVLMIMAAISQTTDFVADLSQITGYNIKDFIEIYEQGEHRNLLDSDVNIIVKEPQD